MVNKVALKQVLIQVLSFPSMNHHPLRCMMTINQAAHYHILSLEVWGSISELAFGWAQRKEVTFHKFMWHERLDIRQ